MINAGDVVPDIRGERRPRRWDADIATLAASQHGVVARRQLATLGLSLDAIDHRVAMGRLHVVHRGVYAVGHRALTRDGRWMAATLAGGDGAVLSHRSAAALWGMRDGSPACADVTIPRSRRPRSGLVARRVDLRADEVTVHRGIPVTTPARTLLDLAAILDEHRLARAAERAEALRLTSPTSLEALAARYRGRPGVPALGRIAPNVAATTTRSELERRFLTLLDAERLPRPLVNVPIEGAEADFAWPARRLVVELDGYETHGTRAAFERDRARDRALQAQGWRVIRITWRQLRDEPGLVAAQLRVLLAGP
jgi:very-short-patch-repair endonuclease